MNYKGIAKLSISYLIDIIFLIYLFLTQKPCSAAKLFEINKLIYIMIIMQRFNWNALNYQCKIQYNHRKI